MFLSADEGEATNREPRNDSYALHTHVEQQIKLITRRRHAPTGEIINTQKKRRAVLHERWTDRSERAKVLLPQFRNRH